MRSEEIPEEDPDEEPEEEPTGAGAAMATAVPSLGLPSREFEFRTDELSLAELVDGRTLAARLGQASKDGWDYVQVIEAGEKRLLLLRRAKRPEKQGRPVGFFPPSRS
jgi:hypothetical protein